jgi:hypothetical protein
VFCKDRTGARFSTIGLLRAFALGFVFPANLEHLGTGIAGILAGFMTVALLKNQLGCGSVYGFPCSQRFMAVSMPPATM